MSKLAKGTVLVVMLVGMLCVLVQAQEMQLGRIKGLVHDSTGAVVTGASVACLSESTGVETKMPSNAAGEYSFDSLPVGSYRITVTSANFGTAVRTGVRVVSGESETVDFNLSPGAVSATVVVAAEAPVLNTTENTVGTTRVTEEIADLPYSLEGQRGRDAAGAALTVSGVKYNPGESTGKTVYVVSRASINGSPEAQYGYYIDGLSASGQGHELGEDFTMPVPEAVSELRVVTNDDAEYGWNSGGGISLTLKSGTNNLHGTLFEYFRNNDLDSRNWFAKQADINKQNEFGFTLGGPVVLPKLYNGKNRTFFFVTYDGFRFRSQSASLVDNVPTLKMRQGDFSELLGSQIGNDGLGRPIYAGEIYDPATTRTLPDGTIIRDPFNYNNQLNNIDPARFSKVSQFFQNGFPSPNAPGIVNNWRGLSLVAPTTTDSIWGKFDEEINDKHRISVGFSWLVRARDGNQNDNGLGGVISSAEDNLEQQRHVRINYNWTVRRDLIFEFAAALNSTPGRNYYDLGNRPSKTGGSQAGLTGQLHPNTPSTSITNITGFGIGGTYGYAMDRGVPINVGLTWIKGSHDIKFGAQYQLIQLYRNQDFGAGGAVSFIPQETGLPGFNSTGAGYSSFLLGAADSANMSSVYDFRTSQGAFGSYVQDQWRVTRKLTANIGLRWDLFVPTRVTGDRIGSFDPNLPNLGAGGHLGAITFWGSGPGRNGLDRLYEYYWRSFEPRVGLAYQITPKTVLRARYGISTPAHFGDFTSGFNAPFTGWGATPSRSSLDNGVTPAFYWDSGFPFTIPKLPDLDPTLQNGSGADYIDRKDSAMPGRCQGLDAGVERELPGKMALRADYVANLCHGLATGYIYQLNQLSVADLSYGSLLTQSVTSPQAVAAGIPLPYPGFTGSVAQALRPYPQYQNVYQLGSSAGFLEYNSMQVNLQKRVGTGLTFLVAYTLSKQIDNGYYGNSGWMDYTPIQAISLYKSGRQLSLWNTPQTLAVSWVYDLPFGPGKPFASSANPVAKQVVAGWRLVGTQNYSSGNPVSVGTEASIPGGFASSGGGIWPVRVPGVPTTVQGCGKYNPFNPAARYLNRAAFADPAPFTFGNTNIQDNTSTCPYLNENFGLIKAFPIREKTNVEFGSYFFNAFNRHQWVGLNSDIDSAAYGTYNSASAPRKIMMYMKVNF